MSNEQLREEFIRHKWRRYPTLPAKVYSEAGWLWGRLDSVGAQEFTLQGRNIHFRLNAGNPETPAVIDEHLGESVPVAALKKGDQILFHSENKTVSSVFLLSPCLEPLTSSVDSEWQRFLESVRTFFQQQDFVHWKTPYLVASSGVDAHIDFFKATGVRTHSSYGLPTSPELELKKVIATGVNRIFEIKSCFRDDDRSPHHRPEFTMLEWYRCYEDKWVLYNDIENLIAFVTQELGWEAPPMKNSRQSIAELFKKYAGMELSPRTAKQELSGALKKYGLDQSDTDDWDDLFFRLYIELIEPHLGKQGLEAIYHFPATQGSLSRNTPDGWSDRFEVYYQGVELANAYQEQNDPHLIEVRARGEVLKRQRLGRIPQDVDEEFLKVMKCGFPPCAGIALGLDRLYMVLKGKKALTY